MIINTISISVGSFWRNVSNATISRPRFIVRHTLLSTVIRRCYDLKRKRIPIYTSHDFSNFVKSSNPHRT
jgi:hypothetical protein